MAEKKKRTRSRAEAGIVEKDFEQQPNSETVAAGEHFDHEAHEELQDEAAWRGQTVAGVIATPVADVQNPYMSVEEQGMEMTPKVFGPPAYGSPDPATSAGRLVPLEEHPLAPENFEGAAAISPDYGADVAGVNLAGGETSHPGGPNAMLSDLTKDSSGGREGREAHDEADATAGARELADAEGVNLADVEGTGDDGRITKSDVQNYIDDRDSNDD